MSHSLWLPTRTPTQNNCVKLKPVSKAKPSEQKVHFSQALALIWAWHLFSIQKRHINLYFGGLPIPLSKSVGFCQFSHWKIRPFLEKWLGTIFDTKNWSKTMHFFQFFNGNFRIFWHLFCWNFSFSLTRKYLLRFLLLFNISFTYFQSQSCLKLFDFSSKY